MSWWRASKPGTRNPRAGPSLTADDGVHPPCPADPVQRATGLYQHSAIRGRTTGQPARPRVAKEGRLRVVGQKRARHPESQHAPALKGWIARPRPELPGVRRAEVWIRRPNRKAAEAESAIREPAKLAGRARVDGVSRERWGAPAVTRTQREPVKWSLPLEAWHPRLCTANLQPSVGFSRHRPLTQLLGRAQRQDAEMKGATAMVAPAATTSGALPAQPPAIAQSLKRPSSCSSRRVP